MSRVRGRRRFSRGGSGGTCGAIPVPAALYTGSFVFDSVTRPVRPDTDAAYLIVGGGAIGTAAAPLA